MTIKACFNPGRKISHVSIKVCLLINMGEKREKKIINAFDSCKIREMDGYESTKFPMYQNFVNHICNCAPITRHTRYWILAKECHWPPVDRSAFVLVINRGKTRTYYVNSSRNACLSKIANLSFLLKFCDKSLSP